MKKIIFATVGLFISTLAQADWVEGKIHLIQNNGNSNDKVVITWAAAPACGSRKLILDKVNFGSSTEMFNRAYAGLLTAIATQKPIRVETLGCSNNLTKIGSVQICASDPCVVE